MQKQIISKVLFFFIAHSAYAAQDFKWCQKRKRVDTLYDQMRLSSSKKSKPMQKVYDSHSTAQLQRLVTQIQTNGYAWSRQRTQIEKLINKGHADPNIMISIPFLRCNGEYPDIPFIVLAMHHNDDGILSCAFKNGANANIPMPEGKTPLFYAMNQKQVLSLVRNGAHIDHKADGEDTVAHNAVKYRKSAQIFQACGQLGFNFNGANLGGWAVLHSLFVTCPRFDLIEESAEISLRYGADLYQNDNAGKTPFDRLSARLSKTNSYLLARIQELDQKIRAVRKEQEPLLNGYLLTRIGVPGLVNLVKAYFGPLYVAEKKCH